MKINRPQLPNIPMLNYIKVFLAIGYVVGCALILAPQIDYQSWYPKSLRYDLTPGIEFTDHQRAFIDFSETEESEKTSNSDQLAFIDAIQKRIKYLGIEQANFTKTDATAEGENTDSVEIRLSEDLKNAYINSLLMPGKTEFMIPKEDVDFEANPLAQFDTASYESVDLSQSDINDMLITNSDEQYTYIELKISKSERDKWDKFVEENPTTTIAVVVDGQINIGWLLSREATGSKNLTLVLMSLYQEPEVLIANIKYPHPVENMTPVITSEDPILDTNDLYILSGVLLLTIAGGLLFRTAIRKERIPKTAAVALLIIGLLTLIKVMTPLISVPAVLALIVVLAVITASDTKYHMLVSVATFVLGAVLSLAYSTATAQVSGILMVSGLTTFVAMLFFYFTGIYDEKL